MEARNPGVWIAAAIALAVLIVGVSVPNKPTTPPQKVEPGATATPSNSSHPAASRAPDAPGAPGTVVSSAPAPGPSRTSPPAVAVNRTPVPTIAPDRVSAPTSPTDVPPAPRIIPRDEAIQAVDNVHFALRDFRSVLGENPEGSNEEITKALMGDNLKQVRVNLPSGSQVSEAGELCDPWGTPYFFHQLSKQKMEIRSAGPDLKMWTRDDIQM